jgi:hypothetical protein
VRVLVGVSVVSIHGADERGDVLQPRVANRGRVVAGHGAHGGSHLLVSRMPMYVGPRYGVASVVAMIGDASCGTA